MNKIYSYLLLPLYILLLNSCQTDVSDELHLATDGLSIEICMENDFEMNGRSMITSSNSVHHIEHIYAYVFEGVSEYAECVYEEKLPWVPSEISKNSYRCRLGAQGLKDNQNYMILVVSTDNNKDTYDFPFSSSSVSASTSDHHLLMIGKKLKDAKLELAAEVPITKIGYSEIFAGAQSFTTADPLIKISLSRRIAGALCYIKDIPAKVNEYHIVGVELHLVGGQNTSHSLCPREQEGKWIFPEVTDGLYAESIKLADCDLKGRGAEPSKDGVTLYIPPTHIDGVLQTLPNTALLSAYLLPVKAQTHFAIVLVGEKRDELGNVTETHVFTKGEDVGYFPVKSSEGMADYSIESDHFYSIGQKRKGYTTEGDRPLSLLGNPIVVKPEAWGDESVDINFPVLRDYVELDNGKDYSTYIYNCTHASIYTGGKGTEEPVDTANINNVPDNEKGWKLIVREAVDNKCNWLYIRRKGEKKWTQSIEVLETVPRDTSVEIWMSDFIEDRILPYDPEKDYREAHLVLTTLSNGKYCEVPIRQYNALIVQVFDGKKNNEDYGHRAFSRLDLGQKFDSKGMPESDIPVYEWGLNEMLASTIFGWESKNTGQYGHYNYIYAVGGLHQDKLAGSAIDRAYRNVKIDGNPGGVDQNKYWFLPARAEINSFMATYGRAPYCISSEFRWSATATGGANWTQAYAASINHHHFKDDILKRNRVNVYPIRQACGFGGKKL